MLCRERSEMSTEGKSIENEEEDRSQAASGREK